MAWFLLNMWARVHTMSLRALLLVGVSALMCGCPEATPYELADAEPDDASTTGVPDAEHEVETETGPPVEPDVERCELPGTEGLDPREYVIQIRNPECSTAVCLHYNQETFCTHLCSDDRDCRDLARGFCELEIFAGDPDMYGWYCVPPSASRFE